MSLALFMRFRSLIARSPFAWFFAALGILLGVIVLASLSRQPEKNGDALPKEVKIVEHFVVGSDTLTTSASALVKKEMLQPLVALTSGTVQSIAVRPGTQVKTGAPLLRLSADYGADRAGLAAVLAEKNQQLTLDMAKLDREILELAAKEARQKDDTGDTETNLALKRLKRQRAEMETALATGALEVEMARAAAAAFAPRAIVSGTIEYLAVQVGDFVTPGTVLALLRTEKGATTLDAFIPPALSGVFDASLPSRVLLTAGETALSVTPSFFSNSETENGFFHIRYLLSADQSAKVAHQTRVTLALPLRSTSQTGETIIPLDALFTHTNHASLFVERDGKAEERTVSVREILGDAVLLNETLPEGTSVLLNRTLVSGETITLAQ